MVILAIFILFVTAVIFLGDGQLRFVSKLALTLVGLGILIPDTYSFKSRVIEANALLLPAFQFPKIFVTAVMLVTTLILFLLIFQYSRPMRMKK